MMVSDKNKELEEKNRLNLLHEKSKNEEKIKLLNHEHILKMERLKARLEIAKLGGKDEV